MKKLHYIYLLFHLQFIVCPCIAQSRAIDSLKVILKNAKHDTTKCNILNAIIEAENDLTLVTKYNNDIITICEVQLSRLKPTQPEYLKFRKIYGGAYGNMAFILKLQNHIPKALECYLKSLKSLEEVNDKKLLPIILNNIALIYFNQGIISKALEYNFKSLKIREDLNDKIGMANSFNNIGMIYKNQEDKLKALEYCTKSLKIREMIGNKAEMAESFNNLGIIYYDLKDIKKSFEYYDKSLKIYEEIGNKNGIALLFHNIGANYDGQDSLLKALQYYNKSLKIYEQNNNTIDIAASFCNIGAVYYKQKKYNKALESCLKSMEIAKTKEIGNSAIIEAVSLQLNQIYKAIGDYKNALLNYELYIQMRDSISNQETKKASIKSQLKYEYEKKAAADSVKVAEEKKLTAVKFKHEQNQRYFLYGGLGLTVLFGLFMFNRFRVTQKQKAIIEQQKQIVEHQKHIVEEKQNEVLASIRYAKRIQQSLLPTEKFMDRILKKK